MRSTSWCGPAAHQCGTKMFATRWGRLSINTKSTVGAMSTTTIRPGLPYPSIEWEQSSGGSGINPEEQPRQYFEMVTERKCSSRSPRAKNANWSPQTTLRVGHCKKTSSWSPRKRARVGHRQNNCELVNAEKFGVGRRGSVFELVAAKCFRVGHREIVVDLVTVDKIMQVGHREKVFELCRC